MFGWNGKINERGKVILAGNRNFYVWWCEREGMGHGGRYNILCKCKETINIIYFRISSKVVKIVTGRKKRLCKKLKKESLINMFIIDIKKYFYCNLFY